MANKKKDKPRIINNIQELNIEIDYDKLADAIVKAQNIANMQNEQSKQDMAEKERQEIIRRRKDYLKEKDFSYTKCRFWRAIRTALNRLRVFKRLLFIPKKQIKLFSAIDGLISSFTTGLLFIVRIILYFFAGGFIISIFWGNDIFTSLSIAFTIFVFAQLVRIAQYEVERLKDRDYILALFVGILTIFSIIISIITLFPDSDILEIKELLTEIKDILQK